MINEQKIIYTLWDATDACRSVTAKNVQIRAFIAYIVLFCAMILGVFRVHTQYGPCSFTLTSKILSNYLCLYHEAVSCIDLLKFYYPGTGNALQF